METQYGGGELLRSELVEHQPQRDEYPRSRVQEHADRPGHDCKKRQLPTSGLEDGLERGGGNSDRLARDDPDEPGAVRVRYDRPLLPPQRRRPRHDIAEHEPGDAGNKKQECGRPVVTFGAEAHAQHIGRGDEREESEAAPRVVEVVIDCLSVSNEAPGRQGYECDERCCSDRQQAPRDHGVAFEPHADGDDAGGHDEGEVAGRQALESAVHSPAQLRGHTSQATGAATRLALDPAGDPEDGECHPSGGVPDVVRRVGVGVPRLPPGRCSPGPRRCSSAVD